MPVDPRKALLRKEILSRRSAFALTAASEDASRAAQANLLAAFPPAAGGKVGLYVALRGEVDTERLCQGWVEAGGRVYYPRATADLSLAFHPRPEGDGGWVRGPHGVPEPPEAPGGGERELDLLVVPGVAFDPEGRRLGRGAGCYDRFLASVPRPRSLVGLAWSWQLLDEIPADDWDVPVDAVVTERGVVRPAGPARRP